MEPLTASGDQPIGFRDHRSVLIQRLIGASLIVVVCVWIALGAYLSAAIAVAAAVLELVSSGGRVTVEGEQVVLRTIRGNDRIRIADIARVDANFTGYLMRAPHLTLHSGQSVALSPFRCSTLLRSRSRAAEQLADYLRLPVSDAIPVFRLSWFWRAAVIAVGLLFGLPLLISGIAELVGGGIVSGIVLVAVGGVLCACALWAIRGQRALRTASAHAPRAGAVR